MAAQTSSEQPPSVTVQPPQQLDWAYMKSSAAEGLKVMPWSNTVLLGMTGAVAGVASGLLGIGGGTVVTPLLAILTPLSQVGESACKLLTGCCRCDLGCDLGCSLGCASSVQCGYCFGSKGSESACKD